MKFLVVSNVSIGYDKGPMSPFNFAAIIDRIVDISGEYDLCVISNDRHQRNSREFKFLPPHCTEDFLIPTVNNLLTKLKTKCISIIYKDSLNILNHPNLLKTIEKRMPDEITLCGFNLTLDIMSTVFHFIDNTKFDTNLTVLKDCVGDLSKEQLDIGLKQIECLGIPLK